MFSFSFVADHFCSKLNDSLYRSYLVLKVFSGGPIDVRSSCFVLNMTVALKTVHSAWQVWLRWQSSLFFSTGMGLFLLFRGTFSRCGL